MEVVSTKLLPILRWPNSENSISFEMHVVAGSAVHAVSVTSASRKHDFIERVNTGAGEELQLAKNTSTPTVQAAFVQQSFGLFASFLFPGHFQLTINKHSLALHSRRFVKRAAVSGTARRRLLCDKDRHFSSGNVPEAGARVTRIHQHAN